MPIKYPGWCVGEGSEITFSWEHETRNSKIFDHYCPQSVATAAWQALPLERKRIYDRWLRHGRWAGNFNARELNAIRETLADVGQSQDPTRVTHDPADPGNAPNPSLDFEYYRLIPGVQRGATLPDHPHQEVTESNCEMCHPTYLNDIDDLESEIDWLYREFTAGSGVGALGAQRANFHVHVAFPIPRGSVALRDRVVKGIVGLTILLNNKGYMHTLSDIDKGMTQFASVLTKSTANRIESFLRDPNSTKAQNNLGSVMDGDGAVCGLAKFTRVGFRYLPYNQLDSSNRAVQVDRIGLELRSGYQIEDFKALVREAVGVIERIGLGLGPGGPSPAVQRCIDSYAAVKSGVQMSHDHITGDVRKFLKAVFMGHSEHANATQVPWAARRSGTSTTYKSARSTRRGMLDQWSFAFVPWEDHPLVPTGHRAGLIQARRTLIAEIGIIKTGCTWYSNRKSTATKAQAQKAMTDVFSKIKKWKRTTRVEQYFELHAAAAAAAAPQAPAIVQGAGVGGGVVAAPPPPPPPPPPLRA